MSASGSMPGSSSGHRGRHSAPAVDEPVSKRRARPRWALAGIVLLVLVVAVATVMVGVVVRNGRDGDRRGAGRVVALDPPPTRDERALLEHIPFAVRIADAKVTWEEAADCQRGPVSSRVVATFECTLAGFGAEEVRYSLYASRRAMDRTYAREVDAVGVEPFTGSCRRGGPADANWQSPFSGAVGSVLPDGRVLCFQQDRVGTIVWTSSRLSILSTASSSGGWKALHRFWSEVAGPFE